jgi:hypothetical protein
MRPAPLLLSLLLLPWIDVHAQQAEGPTGPKPLDGFEREVLAALQDSHRQKRGVVLHVGGEAIAGQVTGIGPDVVALASREHARILVRRERIDAVEAD